MMSPLMHFMISMGIGFCLVFRHPRKYTAIIVLGLVGMLPDLDHFLPLHNGMGVFHNTMALGIIPLSMVMIAVAMETQRDCKSSVYQRFFICIAVVLFSHLLLDMIAGGGVYFGFPASFEATGLTPFPVLELPGAGVLAVSTDFLWMSILGLVLAGNLVQKKIYELFEGYAELPEYDGTAFQWAVPSRD